MECLVCRALNKAAVQRPYFLSTYVVPLPISALKTTDSGLLAFGTPKKKAGQWPAFSSNDF